MSTPTTRSLARLHDVPESDGPALITIPPLAANLQTNVLGSGLSTSEVETTLLGPTPVTPSVTEVETQGDTGPSTDPAPSSLDNSLPTNDRSLRNQTAASVETVGGTVAKKGRGKKKAATEEVGPDSSEGVVAMGLTPFIPGQDAVFNQNRLVGNEAVLSEAVRMLAKSLTKSEVDRVQAQKDILVLLADYKKTLDELSASSKSSSTSLSSNPDFVDLHNAHIETRKAVNQLTVDSSAAHSAIQDSIASLKLQAVGPTSQGNSAVAASHGSDITSPSVIQGERHAQAALPPLYSANRLSGTLSTPAADTQFPRGLKRKNMELPRARPSPVNRGRGGHFRGPVSNRPAPRAVDTSCDVIYGPIAYTGASAKAIADDAVHDVGLDPVAVRSVRFVENQEYISIRFMKVDFATKFVTLRGMLNGQDSCPQMIAFFASEWDMPSGPVASSSGTQLRLSFAMWNINGHLALKVSSKLIVEMIESHSVTFFQETFLTPTQEDVLNIPRGFHVVSQSRPFKRRGRIPGGGVAAVIRDGLDYSVCQTLSQPDLLVLDFRFFFVICAYLIPVGSNWRKWTKADPCHKFSEAVAFCASNRDKPLLVLGDLNARTASTQAGHSDLVRTSVDGICNSRGNWLLDLCNSNHLHVLNGTNHDKDHPGSWTSFQPMGQSVIDYAIASSDFLPMVVGFEVKKHRFDDDHASLHLLLVRDCVQMPVNSANSGQATLKVSSLLEDNCPSELDYLMTRLLETPASDDRSVAMLYGPVFFTSDPTSVFLAVAASPGGAQSAVYCYWGVEVDSSLAFCTDGSSTVAAIMGLIAIVRSFSPNRPLIIYTSMNHIIHTFTHWAGQLSRQGWPCKHAAFIKTAAAWMHGRSASIEFRFTSSSGHSQNLIWLRCISKAKECLSQNAPGFPYTNIFALPEWEYPSGIPCSQPKIFTNVPMTLAKTALPESQTSNHSAILPLLAPKDIDCNSESHRGRARARQMMWDNLRQLLGSDSRGSFWPLIRQWTDPKPRRPAVSLDALKVTFENRMNPPRELPPSFDGGLFAMHQLHANCIPTATFDDSPNHDFSRPFTAEEVDWTKCHIRSHSLNTAKGVDGVGYAEFLDIDSSDLAELFNLCIRECDAPKVWLTTLLVGILKKGRAATNPDSYRLIALECSLLKVLTLLIDRRLRAWMAAENLLPDSQNGFREGYRTNNCSFVLRCAVDRARANGDSLHVAYMDLTNAFPSTNLPTLWLKLCQRGARGPIVDWMRMIYSRMEYVVGMGANADECSQRFKALWGILAGDSASPGFFNFYMADFRPPECRTDIILANRHISHVEMADDVILFQRNDYRALQVMVDYMHHEWCAQNFLAINATKSECMVFGPLPNPLPPITVDAVHLKLVDEFKYVGITFTSTHRCIFAQHYLNKVSTARSVMYSTLAMESFIGSFPIREAVQLYMARVDPHLISGCEVSIDVDGSLLAHLEGVQVHFLRRVLGLHDRSIRAVLFTETGVMPIRYRRIILALRYIIYLLSLPANHYARAAFDDSYLLWTNRRPSWIGDIQVVLHRLPVPVDLLDEHVTNPETVPELIKDVEASCVRALYCEISTDRTSLLWGSHPTAYTSLKMSKYLVAVHVDAHRKALAQILCSGHCLAVEILRYRCRYRLPVPRHRRLCRLCQNEVEDEIHALFHCPGSVMLRDAREEFWESLSRISVEWAGHFVQSDPLDFIHTILRQDSLIIPLAKLAFRVLATYDAVDLYVLPEFIVRT